MSGNVQKTPFTYTQNAYATAKAQEAIDLLGKALPCSVVAIPVPGVPIVTVKFEIQDTTFTTLPNITLPVAGAEYIRIPIQAPTGGTPGTLGVVFPIDTYLGGISGLGGGVADLSQRGNLSTLIFFPVGNKAWKAVDPNALTLYGAADGVVVQDTINKASTVIITPTTIALSAVNNGTQISMSNNSIQATASSNTVTMGPSGTSIAGNGSIQLSAGGHTLTINSAGISLDGILFATHVHTGVQGGTGDTGPPL